MIDKYSQAVANAMKGKCIPYKRETKAVLNEMLDMVAVKHGRWIRPHWKNNNYCCDCSECGGEAMHRDYRWDKNGVYPICPNCGTKMTDD